jgi:hypothetical protein
MSRTPLERLEQGLAEARRIIEQERQRYRYPDAAAFGYLEEAVASYLEGAADLPVRHHGRSPSPPSPGEVR